MWPPLCTFTAFSPKILQGPSLFSILQSIFNSIRGWPYLHLIQRHYIFFLEVPNFWAHHVILFLIPMHILLTGYYHLDHTRAYYFRLALFIGCWFHFNVQLFASIISGFNVSYMLQPPPKTPFTGVWFRWWHAALLALMGWFSGFLIPWVLQEFKLLSHFQKTVDQNKEHKKSK